MIRKKIPFWKVKDDEIISIRTKRIEETKWKIC